MTADNISAASAETFPAKLLDISIDDLELSVNEHNRLTARGLLTVRSILQMDPEKLVRSGYGRYKCRLLNEHLQELDPRMSIGCLAPKSESLDLPR